MPARPDLLASVAPQTVQSEAVTRLVRQHQHEWELCAHDFWYYASKIITEDEEIGKKRQFPLNYDYLHKLNKDIEDNQKVVLLKPRRMIASWLAVMRMQRNAVFCGSGMSGSFDSYRGGIASVGETEASYMVERISKTWHLLPDWMKDRNPLVVDNQMFLRWAKGGTIQAFPMKREGPQSFGFTEFLFDEMAIQEAARSTWTGLIPTLGASGKLLAVSTPNGRMNFFADVWFNKDNRYKDVHRVEIDWWDNPEHDQKWFSRVTAGMNKQMVARMFEKSFSVYEGVQVFPEFDKRYHVGETEVIEGRPMYMGHDFGFLSPALLWGQVNSRDQFLFHREFLKNEVGYDNYLKDSIAFGNTWYDRKKTGLVHFVDPAGKQRYASKARSGAINDIQEIKIQYGKYAKNAQPQADGETQVRFGAQEVGTRSNEGPRLKEFRKLFNLRADGQYGIIVNPLCEVFIEALNGGYVFPESGNSETPEKNDASHVMDCGQYLVTGYNRMFLSQSHAKPQEKPPRIGGRLGF